MEKAVPIILAKNGAWFIVKEESLSAINLFILFAKFVIVVAFDEASPNGNIVPSVVELIWSSYILVEPSLLLEI